MAWITSKTDWSALDSYNYSDLNRVENNLQEVLTLIASLGYPTSSYTFVTNRDDSGIEYLSSVNRIESNVDSVCENFATPETWSKKTWIVDTTFSYKDANRWEQTIEALKSFTILIPESYEYCGTFNAGSDWGAL